MRHRVRWATGTLDLVGGYVRAGICALVLVGTAVAVGASVSPLGAQSGDEAAQPGVQSLVPFFWHRSEHLERPDVSAIEGIVFLTEADYPPFNYRDQQGNLVGFNVDLAKALCAALRVRCRIAAQEWDALIPALQDRSADAVIASMAISERNRRSVDFTYPYFRSPARFVVRKQDRLETAVPESLADKRVGVRTGTAHAVFLETFFSTTEIVGFDDDDSAREALRTGEIDALFGDAAGLMFWLNGTISRACCRFADGAYSEARFFGMGAGIAVALGNKALADALNYALDRVKISGIYDRIYRKHFPLDLY